MLFKYQPITTSQLIYIETYIALLNIEIKSMVFCRVRIYICIHVYIGVAIVIQIDDLLAMYIRIKDICPGLLRNNNWKQRMDLSSKIALIAILGFVVYAIILMVWYTDYMWVVTRDAAYYVICNRSNIYFILFVCYYFLWNCFILCNLLQLYMLIYVRIGIVKHQNTLVRE